MIAQPSHRQKNAKTFAGYFFLLGCLTLPFFNDFPLLSNISLAFRDFSTIFFLLSGVIYIFEYSLYKNYKTISYSELIFIFGSIALVWVSVIWNYNKSGMICGEVGCGLERMISSGLSMSARLGLLLVFIQLIKIEDINRISIYIRIGFYLSLMYVALELIDSYLPYYFNYSGFGILDHIEGYFHLRENNFGGNRTRGLAFEPGYQAVFLIVCLPFLLADPKNRRRTRNILAWGICLVSTAAAAGLLAAVIYFIFYKLNTRKAVLTMGALIISIVLFGYVVYLYDYINYFDIYGTGFTSTITRTASWVAGCLATLDNFTFGVGPGMSGYWVTAYYPDFFSISPEMQSWYDLGRTKFEAPTFASLLTFMLEYGFVSCFIVIGYLFNQGYLQDALRSRIGRASIIALFIVSFGLSGYLVWGYWLFLAITLARGWNRLDILSGSNLYMTT